MNKLPLILILSIFFNSLSFGQNPYYNDYLDADFYKTRREKLREVMPDNSVALFFSNPIRNRSNDVDFVYRQDPNFQYLTGHNQPHSLLLIFKNKLDIDGSNVDELIFIRDRNVLNEIYNGARLAVDEADQKLGIAKAFTTVKFKDFNLDFSQFTKVLFYDFKDDYRDHSEKGDLFELVAQFKQKAGYLTSNEIEIEPIANNLDLLTLDSLMIKLRGVKTKEEISLLRKAVDISTLAQAEVMKAMKPGLSETEIQGLHEYIFKKYRAEYEGYPSIVGAGHNGCVLHYIENYKPEIADGELILMDLGAEYHGYTADVTRTIPVNGKFSKEQKLIYNIVYEAQEAAMKICKEGVAFSDLYQATLDVVNNGLVELGIYDNLEKGSIINPETGRNRFYPHGCCHHIGLDVHDKGEYINLESNMVITIEPGIYIPKGSPADEKWWDIAVRIEDDYLITKDGCELLSDKAPRSVEEIEALMAQPSVFDAVELPELEEKN